MFTLFIKNNFISHFQWRIENLDLGGRRVASYLSLIHISLYSGNSISCIVLRKTFGHAAFVD